MSDTAENDTNTPTSTRPKTDTITPTPPKKSRGRPKTKTPETPQQRIDRLKAELRKAEEEKAAAEQKRAALVGKVVVMHALDNPEYRHQLAKLLRAFTKNPSDLSILAELLD